jgi:hypothetical protein
MKTLFIIINLLTSSDPILPCGVNLPKHFNPNIEYGNLIDVQTKGVVKLDMSIYNNWGQKIMESDMPDNSFNPFILKNKTIKITDSNIQNNSYLNEETYYYSIEFVCANGEKFSNEGGLKLVKTMKK